MAAVLSYSYMTNMISHLTVPLLEPIPNSFEDLAKGSESKLVLESGYVITQTIMVSLLIRALIAWLDFRFQMPVEEFQLRADENSWRFFEEESGSGG